jgi:methionyl-tRNA synthetase
LRKTADTVRVIWKLANGYLAARAPWTLAKTDHPQAAFVVRTAVNLVGICARAAWPIIPAAAEKVLVALGDFDSGVPEFPSEDDLSRIPAGRTIRHPGLLFEKLGPAWAESNRLRFAGDDS